MIASNKQSIVSLLWRSAFNFSKFSKRQTTPKVLRDHRFTHKGMVLRRKQKDLKYDLTNLPASQAHQEHLFFNQKEDMKLLREQAEAREENLKNKHVFEDHSKHETLLLEIQDCYLIANHPSTVLNNLNTPESKELIQCALHRLISDQLLSFKMGDLGIVVTLSRIYLSEDAKIWENLANDYCRLLQKNEYQDKKTLDSSRTKKSVQSAIMTLTSVLKYSYKFNHQTCIDSLSDAASSFLCSNFDVVQDENHRFLLIADVLPLISYTKQIQVIQYFKEKLDVLSKLNINTLTALTHSLYKVKQQNANNKKFDTNTLIDSILLQKIEQAWIKGFDKKNDEIISIFSYSLASMGYSGQTKGLTSEFVEKNINSITNLKNIAFLGESLKKFKTLNQKFFDAANLNLKQTLSQKSNLLTPQLALQFLRISSKKLTLDSQVATQLIQIIDQAFYYEQYKPKQSQYEMIVKTLQKYSQIVDLSNLRIYQTLIGSKKLF